MRIKTSKNSVIKPAARILLIWLIFVFLIFKTTAHISYYVLHKRLNFFAATLYGDCRESFTQQSVQTERVFANLESFIMTNDKARTIIAAQFYLDVITFLILCGIYSCLRKNRRI